MLSTVEYHQSLEGLEHWQATPRFGLQDSLDKALSLRLIQQSVFCGMLEQQLGLLTGSSAYFHCGQLQRPISR